MSVSRISLRISALKRDDDDYDDEDEDQERKTGFVSPDAVALIERLHHGTGVFGHQRHEQLQDIHQVIILRYTNTPGTNTHIADFSTTHQRDRVP